MPIPLSSMDSGVASDELEPRHDLQSRVIELLRHDFQRRTHSIHPSLEPTSSRHPILEMPNFSFSLEPLNYLRLNLEQPNFLYLSLEPLGSLHFSLEPSSSPISTLVCRAPHSPVVRSRV